MEPAGADRELQFLTDILRGQPHLAGTLDLVWRQARKYLLPNALKEWIHASAFSLRRLGWSTRAR